MKRDFAGDVSKESAVLGWIVENTKDEDDPTENKKAAAATTTGEVRKENDASDEQQQEPKKIRTPKQEVREGKYLRVQFFIWENQWRANLIQASHPLYPLELGVS